MLRLRPALYSLLAVCVVCAACHKKPPAAEQKGETAGPSAALPAFSFRDETPDLLLTWVDATGDFHVAQKPSDVPPESKAQVRVVVTTSEAGTGDKVYIADLRTQGADGSYATTTLTRGEWNELGAARRKVRIEALAPKAEVSAVEAVSDPGQEPSAKGDLSKVRVIIYGASWCKPCHDAEKFLKHLGVNVTKKDIEESRAAQAEMQQKLEKAQRAGSSIPVIDVAGTLLVGFSEDALRRAVTAAAAR